MARPLTALVVFFIAFNIFAGMLMASGVDSAIGLDASVGEDQTTDEAIGNSSDVQTGTGTGETLFGMYNVLAGGLTDVFGIIFPGLDMLGRAGVPSYITGGLAGLFSVIMFIDLVSFIRGWGL